MTNLIKSAVGKNSIAPPNQVRVFATAAEERDTYAPAARQQKERIPESDLLGHWNVCAQRPGLQAVMSARHPLEENEAAAAELQRDILDFLGGVLADARVFELGVGIGRMTSMLARFAREVVGCDISPIMLARARENLAGFGNVTLNLGKITELEFPPKSFDLVFDSIVLLHILSPSELRRTVRKMQDLSDRIFMVEHTYERPDFPISKYSILRTPGEYVQLFKPYMLVDQRTHFCAGDTFTMMLFENPELHFY